jgi:hypothetical protein
MDEELERFKTSINLNEFAASPGYAMDSKESWRNSAVMRHPDGDKIINAKNDATGKRAPHSLNDLPQSPSCNPLPSHSKTSWLSKRRIPSLAFHEAPHFFNGAAKRYILPNILLTCSGTAITF